MCWFADGSIQVVEKQGEVWLFAQDGKLVFGGTSLADGLAYEPALGAGASTAEALEAYAAAGLLRVTVNGEQAWPFPEADAV
jgi:hypothetical protein